mmetsp:Transcript_100131/g.122543  ORF Transcript_100131/g.122543 Transcript_100131/m.122543 type:complete len:200 (-) Transcript_100131:884-1483(-)
MVEKSENEFRITILGDGGVGKSCCSLRFVTGMFTSTYDPTIEDSFTKQTNVDNKCAIIHILDTAGQQQYSVLQSIWIREGDGFIIMFDITSIKSYKKALEIHMKIMQTLDVHTYDDMAIVLVGNKSDKKDSRQININEPTKQSKLWKCKYIETSALNNINCNEIFHQCVREIRRLRIKQNPSKYGNKSKKKSKLKCVIL